MATSTISKYIPIRTYFSNISFVDAKKTSNTTPAGVADKIAENPTSHFNKLETIEAGGFYGAITTGFSNNYWQAFIFGYNTPNISVATYRTGTYKFVEVPIE